MPLNSWILEGEVVDNKTGTTYKLEGVEYNKEPRDFGGNGLFMRVFHEQGKPDKARIESVESFSSPSGIGKVIISLETVLEDYTIKNCNKVVFIDTH